jgi:hypothetical protein
MPGPDITSTAVTAGSKIGRAFNLVSFVPSVFLVVLVWALVACGAMTETPDPEKLGHAVAHLTLASVAALLLIAFLVGYVLHPVQFAMTQLLEGLLGCRCRRSSTHGSRGAALSAQARAVIQVEA